MSVAEAVTGKVCASCKVWKSFDSFQKSSKSSDGHQSWCKSCKKESDRRINNYTGQNVRPSDPYIEGDIGYLWAKRKGDWILLEVDAADLPQLAPYNWHFANNYVAAHIGGKHVFMHRFLLGLHDKDSDKDVDHINRVKHCNRRANLRIVCRSTNNTNRKGPQSNNKSGYLGVSKSKDKWVAAFKWKDKTYRKGGFETKEEAAHQYDLFVIEHGPPLAKLNFPERHGR